MRAMGMLFEARMLSPEQAADLLADPELVEDVLDEELPDGWVVDLDKSWHGIHWLLCGSAWEADQPAGQAILGGREVGEDLGYGPARLLDPDGVRAVAEALAAVDGGDLGARMDPGAMAAADLYPQIWDEAGLYDEYLLPHYEQLRAFYARAAAEGLAVLLTLS
jgi:hypothetical protein